MKNKLKFAALIDLVCYVGLGFLLNHFFGVVGVVITIVLYAVYITIAIKLKRRMS